MGTFISARFTKCCFFLALCLFAAMYLVFFFGMFFSDSYYFKVQWNMYQLWSPVSEDHNPWIKKKPLIYREQFNTLSSVYLSQGVPPTAKKTSSMSGRDSPSFVSAPLTNLKQTRTDPNLGHSSFFSCGLAHSLCLLQVFQLQAQH